MLKVTICVGSSCSVRGSDDLAAALERLLEAGGLRDRVELVGSFCMGMCSAGVSVQVGDCPFEGVDPVDAERFFRAEILPRLLERSAT